MNRRLIWSAITDNAPLQMSLPVTKGQALRSALTSRPGLYNVALGVLNGATMWHSFIGGPVSSRCSPPLPFSQF